MSEPIEELSRHRASIDVLDRRILEILNERTAIVQHIARIKEELSMAVYEPKREDQVYANILGHNQGPLPNDAVKRIFERIIDEMRTLQQHHIQVKRDVKRESC